VLGEYPLQAQNITLRILEKRWKSKEYYLKKFNKTGSFLEIPALQSYISGTNQEKDMTFTTAMSFSWLCFRN
jgi:hypothetical protein